MQAAAERPSQSGIAAAVVAVAAARPPLAPRRTTSGKIPIEGQARAEDALPLGASTRAARLGSRPASANNSAGQVHVPGTSSSAQELASPLMSGDLSDGSSVYHHGETHKPRRMSAILACNPLMDVGDHLHHHPHAHSLDGATAPRSARHSLERGLQPQQPQQRRSGMHQANSELSGPLNSPAEYSHAERQSGPRRAVGRTLSGNMAMNPLLLLGDATPPDDTTPSPSTQQQAIASAPRSAQQSLEQGQQQPQPQPRRSGLHQESSELSGPLTSPPEYDHGERQSSPRKAVGRTLSGTMNPLLLLGDGTPPDNTTPMPSAPQQMAHVPAAEDSGSASKEDTQELSGPLLTGQYDDESTAESRMDLGRTLSGHMVNPLMAMPEGSPEQALASPVPGPSASLPPLQQVASPTLSASQQAGSDMDGSLFGGMWPTDVEAMLADLLKGAHEPQQGSSPEVVTERQSRMKGNLVELLRKVSGVMAGQSLGGSSRPLPTLPAHAESQTPSPGQASSNMSSPTASGTHYTVRASHQHVHLNPLGDAAEATTPLPSTPISKRMPPMPEAGGTPEPSLFGGMWPNDVESMLADLLKQVQNDSPATSPEQAAEKQIRMKEGLVQLLRKVSGVMEPLRRPGSSALSQSLPFNAAASTLSTPRTSAVFYHSTPAKNQLMALNPLMDAPDSTPRTTPGSTVSGTQPMGAGGSTGSTPMGPSKMATQDLSAPMPAVQYSASAGASGVHQAVGGTVTDALAFNPLMEISDTTPRATPGPAMAGAQPWQAGARTSSTYMASQMSTQDLSVPLPAAKYGGSTGVSGIYQAVGGTLADAMAFNPLMDAMDTTSMTIPGPPSSGAQPRHGGTGTSSTCMASKTSTQDLSMPLPATKYGGSAGVSGVHQAVGRTDADAMAFNPLMEAMDATPRATPAPSTYVVQPRHAGERTSSIATGSLRTTHDLTAPIPAAKYGASPGTSGVHKAVGRTLSDAMAVNPLMAMMDTTPRATPRVDALLARLSSSGLDPMVAAAAATQVLRQKTGAERGQEEASLFGGMWPTEVESMLRDLLKHYSEDVPRHASSADPEAEERRTRIKTELVSQLEGLCLCWWCLQFFSSLPCT